MAPHGGGLISVETERRREQTCGSFWKSCAFQVCTFVCYIFLFWMFWFITRQQKIRNFFFRFLRWPYLCCGWLARSEPWSRLGRPGSTPPSGSESFLVPVSDCRCGCGQRRATSWGLVCLWRTAAGAGRAKEPRPEHLAP